MSAVETDDVISDNCCPVADMTTGPDEGPSEEVGISLSSRKNRRTEGLDKQSAAGSSLLFFLPKEKKRYVSLRISITNR